MFEVLPTHRRRGVGTQLAKQLFEELDGFRSIDLTCARDLQPYYEKFGMRPTIGMSFRNHES